MLKSPDSSPNVLNTLCNRGADFISEQIVDLRNDLNTKPRGSERFEVGELEFRQNIALSIVIFRVARDALSLAAYLSGGRRSKLG